MKDRILDYLGRFAKGEEDDLSAELISELKQDKDTFIQNCTELRSEILHHYDLFSISTIDAFFQKVIRSFTRESGLIGDFRLEVDDEGVLEEVINNLIDELGEKPDCGIRQFVSSIVAQDWHAPAYVQQSETNAFGEDWREPLHLCVYRPGKSTFGNHAAMERRLDVVSSRVLGCE